MSWNSGIILTLIPPSKILRTFSLFSLAFSHNVSTYYTRVFIGLILMNIEWQPILFRCIQAGEILSVSDCILFSPRHIPTPCTVLKGCVICYTQVTLHLFHFLTPHQISIWEFFPVRYLGHMICFTTATQQALKWIPFNSISHSIECLVKRWLM